MLRPWSASFKPKKKKKKSNISPKSDAKRRMRIADLAQRPSDGRPAARSRPDGLR